MHTITAGGGTLGLRALSLVHTVYRCSGQRGTQVIVPPVYMLSHVAGNNTCFIPSFCRYDLLYRGLASTCSFPCSLVCFPRCAIPCPQPLPQVAGAPPPRGTDDVAHVRHVTTTSRGATSPHHGGMPPHTTGEYLPTLGNDLPDSGIILPHFWVTLCHGRLPFLNYRAAEVGWVFYCISCLSHGTGSVS